MLLYEQLVACLRLCSSVFWCTMNMSLFTAMVLLLRFLFWGFYCQFETDFTSWSTFICYQICIESRRSHQRCSLKRCTLQLRNICRKTSVLGSHFNEVLGLQACNYIKKGLQHRCFLRNLQKFSNTFFEKHLETTASQSRLVGWVKVKKITERSSQ